MGYYTGLRFKIKVKEEYRDIIEFISSGRIDWKETDNKFMQEYGCDVRADFIPHGDICYVGDFEGFEKHVNNYDINSEIWEVCCSLKNYEHTIEKFIFKVYDEICEEEYYSSVVYEEDEEISSISEWMERNCLQRYRNK